MQNRKYINFQRMKMKKKRQKKIFDTRKIYLKMNKLMNKLIKSMNQIKYHKKNKK